MEYTQEEILQNLKDAEQVHREEQKISCLDYLAYQLKTRNEGDSKSDHGESRWKNKENGQKAYD